MSDGTTVANEMALRSKRLQRVAIENVEPRVDNGRFPVKRVAGDDVRVEADIFADGHDALAARVLHRRDDAADWREVLMRPQTNDRWTGTFDVPEVGRHVFTVEAWPDPFASWVRDLRKRLDAQQDVAAELEVGAGLVREASSRARTTNDEDLLKVWARELSAQDRPIQERAALAFDQELHALMETHPDRRNATRLDVELAIEVGPSTARASAWYEFFPRSFGSEPGRHGTLRDAERILPRVADMGFDVVYLPPIHPIGRTNRKGRNNDPNAQPGDVGSPWAIGAREGGHKDVHPRLGRLQDLDHFVATARDLGLDVAIDIAFQCSPDHPYVKSHPDWFRHLPDGTIRFAENPPKKYQDIYPIDFETPDWQALWQELKSVVTFWASRGIRRFRVDNPHTKPLPFWEWLIREVKRDYPDALFLSEAFTRPKVMYRLAKVGFDHSYTYFAWRNSKWELTHYVSEVTEGPVAQYFRPHFWPNTPDILTEHLQVGGRAAFMARFVLAATLAPNYGIYGPPYERLEREPAAPGSEEYRNSEKYELRQWDLDGADGLGPFLGHVNRIRRDNPALLRATGLRFHRLDTDHLVAYSRRTEDRANVLLIVVNTDPHHTQSGMTDLDLEELGVPDDHEFQVHDLLSDGRYIWRGRRNYVEIRPHEIPAHIFRIHHRIRSEHDFDYFQ